MAPCVAGINSGLFVSALVIFCVLYSINVLILITMDIILLYEGDKIEIKKAARHLIFFPLYAIFPVFYLYKLIRKIWFDASYGAPKNKGSDE